MSPRKKSEKLDRSKITVVDDSPPEEVASELVEIANQFLLKGSRSVANEPHEKFCQLVGRAKMTYKAAYKSAVSTTCAERTASVEGNRLVNRNPHIKERIEFLRAEMTEMAPPGAAEGLSGPNILEILYGIVHSGGSTVQEVLGAIDRIEKLSHISKDMEAAKRGIPDPAFFAEYIKRINLEFFPDVNPSIFVEEEAVGATDGT